MAVFAQSPIPTSRCFDALGAARRVLTRPAGRWQLRTYNVIQEGNEEAPLESVDNLPAATASAERHARSSTFPILVRERDSGREMARYPPGQKLAAPVPTEEKKRTSDALARLKAANARLKDAVAPLFKKRNEDPK